MSNDAASASARFFSVNRLSRWRSVGLGFVFLWFFLGGIAHFAATRIEMRIVPP